MKEQALNSVSKCLSERPCANDLYVVRADKSVTTVEPLRKCCAGSEQSRNSLGF